MKESAGRLLAAFGASILLHGVVFVTVTREAPKQMERLQGLSFGPRASVLDVRLADRAKPDLEVRPPSEDVVAMAGQSSPEKAAPEESVPETVLPLPAVPVPEKVDPEYWPSRDLDGKPSPLSPIIVPFPDVPLAKPGGKVILVLYIGIDGAVVKAEVDRSDLPPVFEKAAQEAFLGARMTPGTKGGVPVPSRMKIEVGFEEFKTRR